MKSELKMPNNIYAIIAGILVVCQSAKADSITPASGDTIPSAFSRPVQWRIGAEVSPVLVPGTSSYLEGDNPAGKPIDASMSGSIRADFSFSPATREGMLYRGAYQGIGVSFDSYSDDGMLGTPVSAFVYQGAPIARFSNRLWLGYEWQFGAAFGWRHSNEESVYNNAVVSTAVTAHMGLGVKLHYMLSDKWQMSVGIGASHYSNGNTSWPNAGVNTIGATIGIARVINPDNDDFIAGVVSGNGKSASGKEYSEIKKEADRHCWLYDIMVFGAWRKRIVNVGDPVESKIIPGKFGILGLQLSPMYRLDRRFAVGPALDVQWDESAGLAPYWVDGSYDDNIKFVRPPFGKQLSVGVSGHAELTMPIFTINAGLGYDIVCPNGNKRFYQSLALKTFLTKKLYLNVGYRLGSFKEPQNLMLGFGVRLQSK